MGALAAFVAKQDQEIERTCNQHYQVRVVRPTQPNAQRPKLNPFLRRHAARAVGRQGFVVSVDQLLTTRQVAHKLKLKIADLNALVQETGRAVADKVRPMRAHRCTGPPRSPRSDQRGEVLAPGATAQQRELHKLEVLRHNMGLASATLRQCRHVLSLAKHVDEHFRAKEYFAALKVRRRKTRPPRSPRRR